MLRFDRPFLPSRGNWSPFIVSGSSSLHGLCCKLVLDLTMANIVLDLPVPLGLLEILLSWTLLLRPKVLGRLTDHWVDHLLLSGYGTMFI